ncbi:MAG: hypothetical protein H6624_11585 [Bdellovibrionaceae bacterium]|nr:hypothetical protein [Bdellovibrionales bacterium]MCB9084981.1 hypothetical protein [Pseudobdellovibrionaceae bacterium]
MLRAKAKQPPMTVYERVFRSILKRVVAFLVVYLLSSIWLWGSGWLFSAGTEIVLAAAVALLVMVGGQVVHIDYPGEIRDTTREFVRWLFRFEYLKEPRLVAYLFLLVVVVGLIAIFKPHVEQAANGDEWILAPTEKFWIIAPGSSDE